KMNELTQKRIAVNFSPKQFLQKNLVEKIQKILDDNGVHPSLLEIEITESVLLNNEEVVLNVIQQLRRMGIRISIDDFGTGFSSFNYLRHFPVDTIKIDKSYIKDLLPNKSDSQAFIQAMTSIAHALKLSVIAEGVETEEQLNFITKEKCNEFQG